MTSAQPRTQSSDLSEVIDPGQQPGQSGVAAVRFLSQSEPVGVIRDILLVSDSGSLEVRDFEGFSEQGAQVHQSRTKSRSKKGRKKGFLRVFFYLVAHPHKAN